MDNVGNHVYALMDRTASSLFSTFILLILSCCLEDKKAKGAGSHDALRLRASRDAITGTARRHTRIHTC